MIALPAIFCQETFDYKSLLLVNELGDVHGVEYSVAAKKKGQIYVKELIHSQYYF